LINDKPDDDLSARELRSRQNVYFAEEGESRQLFNMCAGRHIAVEKLLLVVNPYKHANEFTRYLTMVII
jgi:hypothetical protein